MPTTTISASASATDFHNTARSGGAKIWVRALMASSNIFCLCQTAEVATPGGKYKWRWPDQAATTPAFSSADRGASDAPSSGAEGKSAHCSAL